MSDGQTQHFDRQVDRNNRPDVGSSVNQVQWNQRRPGTHIDHRPDRQDAAI